MYEYQRYNQYSYPQYQQPQQIQQQFPQQIIPQQAGLCGRMVNSVEEVTANDVPMNAPFAIFPKADGSEIYIKSWSANGLIQTVTYKPQLDGKQNELPKEDTATLFAPIMERLDQIEDKITQSQRTTRAKKESDSE
ncbi:MAG: hypothetical protein ACLSG4_08595 [Anaerobutyricum sp.]